jgi:ABC-2 type transport system ATP-binding protein
VLAHLGVEVDAGHAASDRDLVTGVQPDLAGAAAEQIVAALVAAGVRVRGFEVLGASLEQRFVELTGEGFDVVR